MTSLLDGLACSSSCEPNQVAYVFSKFACCLRYGCPIVIFDVTPLIVFPLLPYDAYREANQAANSHAKSAFSGLSGSCNGKICFITKM